MSKVTRSLLSLLAIAALISGCATDRRLEKEDFSIETETSSLTPIPERTLPEAAPAITKKPLDPLEGKAITITAKDARFTDIFSAIAEIAGLDLVIDSRITTKDLHAQAPEEDSQSQPDTSQGPQQAAKESSQPAITISPITVSFSETPLRDALENLSASQNIFYEIRGNSLLIRGTQSKTYHLNFLSSQKETKISVGGDVLANSGSNASSGNNPLAGEFSIKDTTPTTSSDIYTQIEDIVKSSLSQHGSYYLNRAIGFLEVNDRRDRVERIDAYVNTIRRYYNSQVLITAKILEVSLSDSARYGIDWSSIHGNIQDYVFNPIQQNLALPTDNLVPSLEIQVQSQKHGFDATLNALAEFGTIKVLSNPRIRVTNGQPALISVGTNSSYIREIKLTTTTIEGGSTIITPEVDIGTIFDGIMLGVLPYIDLETDTVNLSITPIKSRVVELLEKNISGNIYTLPTVDLKEASTQIRVRSGNIIALGGLISKNLSNETKSIPILGDIPYVGYLFSQKIKAVETNELVILLEPVILEQ